VNPLGGAPGPSLGAKGGGRQRGDAADHSGRQAAASQPDPMKTSFGYIGADSFTRQRQDQGQRRGGANGAGGGGQRRPGRGR
jgi:23S rRNA pseudouridine2605 synthase